MDKEFFGPYIKSAGDEKWHWIKSCSHFPKADFSTMISSKKPSTDILCAECTELENRNVLRLKTLLNENR